MKKSKAIRNPFYPIIIALLAIIAVFSWGIFQRLSDNPTVLNRLNPKSSANKLSQLVNYIDEYYVDTIQKEHLVDQTIQKVLQDLDPHSYYITKEEMRRMNEPLEGNFDGVGIEFRIIKDTLVIISVVEDGPSEKVGLLAGDRIIEVDSMHVAGVGLTNSDVFDKLRGPAETEVDIKVLRNGNPNVLDFTVTRGKIPIYSVASSYMLDNKTGYIKLIRFSKTTEEEFHNAASNLKNEGMTSLILDLRGNGGGFLNAAIAICDEFLGDNKLVVYTMGKSQPRHDHYATTVGELERTKVVVLIDQNSASASEIVAGALQDNDRGTIMGRRSFGKGLVQTQLDLYDKSAIRLTIARYYTPTGRSIQKPYGNGIDYDEEYYQRYESGELSDADSIHVIDSLKFITPKGKVVYGGGGIVPDVFLPLDESYRSSYFAHIIYSGMINNFAFDYADSHRDELLSKYDGNTDPNYNFVNDFEVSDQQFNKFVEFTKEGGFDPDKKDILKSEDMIKNRIKALIGRNIWDNDIYYKVLNQKDSDVKSALEISEEGEAI
ncbi:MAG: peptidase S41 [Bacteroidetes bacterium]|nr:MAG: peptidase S41 [Bacteroidota bacterium]